MSNKFSGKIFAHSSFRDSITFALHGDHTEAFQMFIDQSLNYDSAITGIAAAFRHHGEAYWQEVIRSVMVLDHCFEHENERDLLALSLALDAAFDRVEEKEKEVRVFVDNQHALDRLDQYRVGDGKWGAQTLNLILFRTDELKKKGKEVTLHWIPSTEHDFSAKMVFGSYIGYGPYGHNWADFMARRAAGYKDREIPPSYSIRRDLQRRPKALGKAPDRIENEEEAKAFQRKIEKAAEDYWFSMPVEQSS